MHACMHAFKHAYVHVTYTHPHTHMRTCMLAYIVKYKRCTEVYTQAHDLFVLRLYVYGLICHSAFVHIHIYIYTYMYTYIYIYMYGPPPPSCTHVGFRTAWVIGIGGGLRGFCLQIVLFFPAEEDNADSIGFKLYSIEYAPDPRFKIQDCKVPRGTLPCTLNLEPWT